MKQSITMLTEVKKSIRGYDYEGVHYVTCGDQGTNRPIVVGEVDPAKLRQKYNNNKKENGPQTVELNRGKKVEIFSPLPKKHEDEEKKKENRGGREGNKKKEAKDEPKEEPQVKKFKEEKSKNKEGEKKNKDEQNKSKKTNKDDGRNKDVKKRITMTLKQGCKCVDCASKVMNYIRGLEGVESVNGDSWDQNRLTVIGKVDPIKLQEMVEQKTHKKITLSCEVCPLPEKDKDDNKENGGAAEESRNKEAKDKPKKNPEEKNSKPPVTTAVLKVHLHCEQCEGCINKIKKIISNIEGYHKVTIDCAQDLVIVKGSMDMKALGESLKQQLKKDVQIVLTKEDGKEKEKKCGREGKTGGDGGRDGEKKRKSGGKKKEKGSGAEESGREEKKGRDDDKASKKKERNGGEKEKEEGDRKTGGEVGGDGGEQVEQYQFAYQYQYQYHSPYHFYAPQMFSDENPNACSIL